MDLEKMILDAHGQEVTTDELKARLYKAGASSYQVGQILRKHDGQQKLWYAESTNWIFVYSGTTMIGGIDHGSKRNAR